MMFKGKSGLDKRLNTLLMFGSTTPSTRNEMLCTISVLSSPFCHIPIVSSMVKSCVESITDLTPFHQPPLLDTLLSLEPKSVRQYLPSMVGLFALPSCASRLSDYFLNELSNQTPGDSKVFDEFVAPLCEAGILTTIAGLICDLGPSVPANVVILLTQLILSFQRPTHLLLSQATEVLNSVFSIDSAVESGMIIASHLARMSKDFLSALSECGALNLAERALQADIPLIKTRALDFIGNICRHTALPNEYLERFTQLLIENIKDSPGECQKMAAFALGNVIFWSPSISCFVIDEIESINKLLASKDPKTVENAAGILGNIVRKSDQYVKDLIQCGSLTLIVKSIHNYDELQGRTILPLSCFCQYDSAREFLKNTNLKVLLGKYINSPNERIARYSKSIIDSLS